jgi:hypothetical protein
MEKVPLTTAWMETQSGKRFNPSEENPSYSLHDMMWGIARECRYAGQLRGDVDQFTVAEHLVLLTRWAIANMFPQFRGREPRFWPDWARRELRTLAMHDIQEGLLKDMTRPTKKLVPQFCELEDRFFSHVAKRYDLINPLPAWVHDLDNRIIADERRQALNPSDNVWAADKLEPLGVTLSFWPPRMAFQQYRFLLLELGVEEDR